MEGTYGRQGYGVRGTGYVEILSRSWFLFGHCMTGERNDWPAGLHLSSSDASPTSLPTGALESYLHRYLERGARGKG
jgi:hypothetical protein